MTLYEENCKLIDYNYKKEKAKFSCDIKINITKNYKVKFNKKEFFKNFIDINNIANINVMKCYMIVLKIKSLIKNYGSYIISSIISQTSSYNSLLNYKEQSYNVKISFILIYFIIYIFLSFDIKN